MASPNPTGAAADRAIIASDPALAQQLWTAPSVRALHAPYHAMLLTHVPKIDECAATGVRVVEEDVLPAWRKEVSRLRQKAGDKGEDDGDKKGWACRLSQMSVRMTKCERRPVHLLYVKVFLKRSDSAPQGSFQKSPSIKCSSKRSMPPSYDILSLLPHEKYLAERSLPT